MKLKSIFAILIAGLINIVEIETLPPKLKAENNIFGSLESSSNIGAFANTESQASAQGLGSTVGISGIVSGDTASTTNVVSNQPGNSVTSGISSQVDCSEYSTASAQGSDSAEAISSGDCQFQSDNTGTHGSGKVNIGMEGQVMSGVGGGGNGAQQPANNQGLINQSTSQFPSDGSAEAYQSVHGPQATSSFSGVIASAHQTEQHVVSGPSETIMSHSIGQTNVETFLNSNPHIQVV